MHHLLGKTQSIGKNTIYWAKRHLLGKTSCIGQNAIYWEKRHILRKTPSIGQNITYFHVPIFIFTNSLKKMINQ